MYANNAADFTLALALTVLFGLLTFLAWRSRGTGALLKGAGITLLPLALWLTHTLRLASSIVDDIGNWATGLVFSPQVWIGLIVAAVAVVLVAAGTAVGRRSAPTGTKTPRAARAARAAKAPVTPAVAGTATPRKRRAASSGDPEMDEIEALLRDRGIS